MESTPSGSADLHFPLRLPEAMQEELRRPLGSIVKGPAVLKALNAAKRVATVGDYCTADLMERGRAPDLAVVDLKTKRTPDPVRAKVFAQFPGRRIRVKNPAGEITHELWRAVNEAFKSDRRVLIEVQGEEDLAALVCIAVATDSWAVLYGMPDRGVVVVKASAGARSQALDILRRMDRGD